MKLTRILLEVFILLGTTSAQSGDSGIFSVRKIFFIEMETSDKGMINSHPLHISLKPTRAHGR